MASKIIGSIVATEIATGLKVVLHVHKNGGSIRFTRPDIKNWSHSCHPVNEKTPEGWVHEVRTIAAPTYSDPVYYPV